MARYYVDTCIWIDHFENRRDKWRPLGEWAVELFNKIIEREDTVVMSNVLLKELSKYLNEKQINDIWLIFPKYLIEYFELDHAESAWTYSLAKNQDIPLSDAIHIALARKSKAILVTRDKHFEFSKSYVQVKKPEELF